MDPRAAELFAARRSGDRQAAYQAFVELMELCEAPVDWAYEVWDQTRSELSSRAGAERAFAAQLLSRLALSDPEARILGDFPLLAALLRDEKPVTARHTLQSIWRVGLAGPEPLALVLRELEQRFDEAAAEPRGSLVRTDVLTALGQLAAAQGDPRVAALARALLTREPDPKALRKQRASWKKASGSAL